MNDFVGTNSKFGMIYELLLEIIIVAGIATIIVILARAVPRIDGSVDSSTERFIDRILGKVPLASIDAMTSIFFEKLLRKVRVLVLRIENMVTNWINYFRSGNGKTKNEMDTAKENLFEK